MVRGQEEIGSPALHVGAWRLVSMMAMYRVRCWEAGSCKRSISHLQSDRKMQGGEECKDKVAMGAKMRRW